MSIAAADEENVDWGEVKPFGEDPGEYPYRTPNEGEEGEGVK